jgi:hypothetical protein
VLFSHNTLRIHSARICVGAVLLLACAATTLHAQSAAPARYRVSSTSVITLERPPQTPLVDTVLTTSLLSIDVSFAQDSIATLTVDSLSVSSTGMIRRATNAFSRGISVSVPLINGRPLIVGDSASACSSERPMAALLPELMPSLPTPLRPEQQWFDTLTVTTCRAGLPVTTISIAAYRSLTGMDSTTVLVERRTVTTAAGSALLKDQTVTLVGTGTGESLAVVHVQTRRVQSLRGTQSLDVQLTNGQQSRRMIQQISDSATLLP